MRSNHAIDGRRGMQPEARAKAERASASLLLRCWLEPSRVGAPTIRGVVRDLRSGEEQAFSGLQAMTEQVMRQLGASVAVPEARQRRETGA